MESNQGSGIGNDGLKQEIMVFPGRKNERNDDVSAVYGNGVPVVGSLGGTKENGKERDDKLGGMNTSILMCSVVCGKTEELQGNGSGEGDAANVDERNSHAFLVGDLVWGKIRSQPWWPGLIYDPADASDMASRFRGENKLLVGYFGDGSCAWCSPSQLVPFVEHYEEMSKESSSKSFVCAVEEALKELGRRAELKMICSCVPERNLTDLARPEAMNAAARSGIHVPNGAIDKLPSPWCEPAELLSFVRKVALAGSSNLLELVLVKSWLSSFSRVKRGCSLHIYQKPQLIGGLEDESENSVLDIAGFSVPPIQVPSEEEEHSGTPETFCLKYARKRHRKSVAKLMGADKAELKGKKKGKIAAETPSTTARNREAASDDDIKESGIGQASTAGRMTGSKKIDNFDSHAIVVYDGLQIERVDNENTRSIVLKKDELTLKRYTSRERKNSKYLREPYTVPLPEFWRYNSKRGLETKFDKIVKSANVGDRLTKVAGQLTYSPSLTKCNSAVSEEEMSVQNSQNFNEISASANQVVGEVLSAAPDISSMDKGSIEPMRLFMSASRSAADLNTCNYQLYHDQISSKKRKGDIITDLNNAADVSAQPAAHSGKIDKPRSRVTKLKKAARAAAESKKVDIVRKNLVNMTSMLNQCDGNISAEEKSNLESEVRSMLQKIIDLEVKASS